MKHLYFLILFTLPFYIIVKYPYPKNTVDFFAIYDMTKDDWYIIPRSATGDAMNIRLAYKRQGKYTCYKNNFGFKK